MSRTAAYRETFLQHRRLLLLPIILAVVIAAWAAVSSPKSYTSAASLWVDNAASTDSSLGNLNPAILPPAQEEQQIVAELLATRQFTQAVATRSGLLQYLASHDSAGSGPAAVMSALGGRPSLESRMAAALNPTTVTMTVRGPQVLGLDYIGPTPALAQRTLKAIVAELQQDSALFAAQHSQSAVAYDRAQVQAASRAVREARDQLSTYLSKHHSAGSGDLTLAALQTAQSVANSQLTQANSSLNTAGSAGRIGAGAGSTARLVDAPSIPSGPTSGKKKQLLAVFGGLFAGLLISFLGVIALTPAKAIRWDDDDPVLDPFDDAIVGERLGSELPTNGSSLPSNGSALPTNGTTNSLAPEDLIAVESYPQSQRRRRRWVRTPS